MRDRVGVDAALSPAERARLNAFADAFDRVDATAYPRFADLIVTDEVRAAQERAIAHIDDGPRGRAIQAAVETFTEAGARAYPERSTPQPVSPWFLGGIVGMAMGRSQARRDRSADCIRFLATIDRAVVALILWDELDPFDRARLLGPWGTYVDVVD